MALQINIEEGHDWLTVLIYNTNNFIARKVLKVIDMNRYEKAWRCSSSSYKAVFFSVTEESNEEMINHLYSTLIFE